MDYSGDVREREMDSYSSMENREKLKERTCLLTDIKKRHARCFVGVVVVLLALLMF